MDTGSLIADLRNPDDDARWKATERLAGLGGAAVDDVLRDLIHAELGEKLRQSYLFILEHQWDPPTIERLEPVTQALHGLAFRAESPVAAERALKAGRRNRRR
ncbi:MAG: hypothetical protein ACRDF8_13310 [Chloroflexota bacterium]